MDHDNIALSPILPEHEHGLGASGLRRIRQTPPSRVSTMPPTPEASFSLPSRASSMILQHPQTFAPGMASPNIHSEDLKRFPTESLHSFSFAHQSEDILHHRQNVMKMSIDMLRDKSGWAANNQGLINAQAKVSGDMEMQSMMELLARANMLDAASGNGGLGMRGPLTGPPNVDGDNVFDRQFKQDDSTEATQDRLDQTSPSASPTSPRSPPRPAQRSNEALPYGSPREPPPPMSLGESSVAKSTKDSTSRGTLKRTYTDTTPLTLQTRLTETLARPYLARDGQPPGTLLSPTMAPPLGRPSNPHLPGNHGQRWVPAAQAVFTTGCTAPWTILAANDLACLVFGVTRAEVRKLGILEMVREDRRQWLEEKLRSSGSQPPVESRTARSQKSSPNSSTSLGMRGGITALLLSKAPSRLKSSKKASDDGSGSPSSKAKKGLPNHHPTKSRGVLLCGEVVPIQKRNGATGSASLWVKERKGGLIWVVEEILEDVVNITLDELGKVLSATGAIEPIWGPEAHVERREIKKLIPRVPMTSGFIRKVDYDAIQKVEHFTARNPSGFSVPVSVLAKPALGELKVSSFPHIAGMMVLSSKSLRITSTNCVFSAALFGYKTANGMHITELVPQFTKLIDLLQDLDSVDLEDGIVISEQSFRRARAILAHREGSLNATEIFLRPSGLIALHRDGTELNVDIQMRVVKSDPQISEESIIEEHSDESDEDAALPEVMYALWITYSRNMHSVAKPDGRASPLASRPSTPPRQPSPGQPVSLIEPEELGKPLSPNTLLAQQIKEATTEPISRRPTIEINTEPPHLEDPPRKRTISDFTILEDMGQGAYGQVKLARHKRSPGNKVVLKYVTKKRILVDTWTRDRKLGTVPLEIHVLDFLRRDGLKHPNIVEMVDFFEDHTNYYIEMVPHGLPGLDLFDYIEMRANMDEAECKHIFLQVVDALHHLHTKAQVVHRDIKDENIILDGENNVKLVDFGSAAYVKSGPFDVFVGTIGELLPVFHHP